MWRGIAVSSAVGRFVEPALRLTQPRAYVIGGIKKSSSCREFDAKYPIAGAAQKRAPGGYSD
jgi:hypothetical protein